MFLAQVADVLGGVVSERIYYITKQDSIDETFKVSDWLI